MEGRVGDGGGGRVGGHGDFAEVRQDELEQDGLLEGAALAEAGEEGDRLGALALCGMRAKAGKGVRTWTRALGCAQMGGEGTWACAFRIRANGW